MNRVDKPNVAEVQQCVPIPDFERLNYYYGQALGVAEFQAEQHYFREKLRLHNRCLHGYGIVCGLDVKPMPVPEDCLSEEERRAWELKKTIAEIDQKIAQTRVNAEDLQNKQNTCSERDKLIAQREELQRLLEKFSDCFPKDRHVPAELYVDCGWALDCEGREIIVRQPQRVDLWSLLSAAQRQEVKQAVAAKNNEVFIELSICYCEQPSYPSRPVVTDTCAPVSRCVYGRTREGFKFRVNLTSSAPDKRCGNCCESCEDECVVLAHIDWNPALPITEQQIDLRPRRDISLYKPTVITGMSWKHGATYTPQAAIQLLGSKKTKDSDRTTGIEVTFSKSIWAETLQPGVVELIKISGGRGPSAAIYYLEGSFVDTASTGLIASFKYQDATGETLNNGDRVHIIIRGNFILDECCQPVDGEHVGGLVPQLKQYEGIKPVEGSLRRLPLCAEARRLPWTSGNGRPGSTFESWFFISESEGYE
jgi:hypothetical protein